MITLISGQEDSIIFDVGPFLTSRQRTLEDADDIVFLIKERQSDLDNDSKVTKKFSTGDIKKVGTDSIVVSFSHLDYGRSSLIGGEKYVYGLGFNYPDLPNLLEPQIVDKDGRQSNHLIVKYNFINNHRR